MNSDATFSLYTVAVVKKYIYLCIGFFKDSIILFVVKPVRVMTIIKKPVRVYNKRYGLALYVSFIIFRFKVSFLLVFCSFLEIG